MKYIIRNGVVLTDICGESLLVAGKEARAYCPYVIQINDSAAFIYKAIAAGLTTDETKREIAKEYDLDDQTDFMEVLDECIQQFKDLGYIIQGE